VQLTESRAERVSAGAENRLKIQCLLLKSNTLAWSDPEHFGADASIVCLASETGIQNIVTFDKKDFVIYRLPKKKSFTLIP